MLEECRAGSDLRRSAGRAGGLGRGEFEQEAVGAPRLPMGTPFLATSNEIASEFLLGNIPRMMKAE